MSRLLRRFGAVSRMLAFSNAVVEVITVFSESTALFVKVSHIVLMLAKLVVKVLCFADVRGRALGAWDLINDTLIGPSPSVVCS